jgi:hypothetical protein
MFDERSGFDFAETAFGERRQHIFVKVRTRPQSLSKRAPSPQVLMHHAAQPLVLFVALWSGHLPLISFHPY